ncbi:unnamed protein product, partial [Prunus brigantina]
MKKRKKLEESWVWYEKRERKKIIKKKGREKAVGVGKLQITAGTNHDTPSFCTREEERFPTNTNLIFWV